METYVFLLFNEIYSIKVRGKQLVFLDMGSSRSYILKGTANKLELTLIAEEENYPWFIWGQMSKQELRVKN